MFPLWEQAADKQRPHVTGIGRRDRASSLTPLASERSRANTAPKKASLLSTTCGESQHSPPARSCRAKQCADKRLRTCPYRGLLSCVLLILPLVAYFALRNLDGNLTVTRTAIIGAVDHADGWPLRDFDGNTHSDVDPFCRRASSTPNRLESVTRYGLCVLVVVDGIDQIRASRFN